MKQLATQLIANRQTRQLSALGFKQLSRIKAKAAEANGTHRYSRDAQPLMSQIETLVYSLIFDHNITKEQLSDLQRNIKVVNNKLELPSLFISHDKDYEKVTYPFERCHSIGRLSFQNS